MAVRLSLEDLMDLAEKELDAIEAGERFADTETWLAVLSFVQRVEGGVSPPPLPEKRFISDADDMLHDIEAEDAADRGKLTLTKVGTIRRMIEKHGCRKEWVAKQLQLTVDEIDEALDVAEGIRQLDRGEHVTMDEVLSKAEAILVARIGSTNRET